MGKPLDYTRFRDNPSAIAAYLTEELGENELASFVQAIRRVMISQGVLALSKETGLLRVGLYRMFNAKRDPQIGNVLKMLDGFGVKLVVVPKSANPKPPRAKSSRRRSSHE